MLWLGLTITMLATLAGLHFWWRGRFLRAQRAAGREMEKLKEEQQQAGLRIETREAALFNSMVEGFLLLDENGRIRLANRAFGALFGISGDVRSRTIMESLRLHELAELVELLGTEKQVQGYELKVSQPGERWVEVNGAAIFNGNGARHGTILVFHDLTRLKQLEGARKEFVANVSHELRTPLSLIKGYVETLLDGAKDNPEVSVRFLQTIDRNAERLKLLVEDLLTISEVESGRLTLNLQAVALGLVVQKVFEDFKSRAAARKVKLINQVSDLKVRADVDRLEQVLGNLLDNAIKYGRNEGQVIVGGRSADEGMIEVFVEDDGPGIPAEALERVFERFYRVDKARSREHGGTGLGLSIVKHIVQGHGGRVWASSEVGHGTTFSLTLPAASGGLPGTPL